MTWEDRFRTAIQALSNACGAVNVRWMLIGGMAVIARGAPRTTEDVDATVFAPGLDVDRFLAECHRHGIAPRLPDVKQMALQAHILLLQHTDSGVDLEVSLAWLGFEQRLLLRHAKTVDLVSVRAQVKAFAEWIEAPERLEQFDALVARVT